MTTNDQSSTTAGHSLLGRPRGWRWFATWAAVIVVAVSIAQVFRTYVAQGFSIPSSSMAPTLDVGDRIMVSKVSVRFGAIHRGDVVVFVAPADVSARCGGSAQTYLVKRVVGLPGDHLESHGTTIYVNARALRETWGHSREFGVAIPSGTTVPPASYYVIGDNNFESCDSRYWGPVPRSMIVGRVFLRIWPPTRIGLL